ncbi:MAG: YceI family protein [Nocardioidaceae bacterium]
MTETTVDSTLQLEGLVPGTWMIDPAHSEVGFTVRHLMSKVRGQFRTFEGSLQIAADALQSSVQATIALSSVDTGSSDRDNHLRSADFFDVETSPQMTFRSTSVRQDGQDLVASGALTIRDTTKPVELALKFIGMATDPWGGTRAGFEAATTLSRNEWGVSFNMPLEGDKVLIGDKIIVVISVEAVLQPDHD